jgi:hypothetical protein
MFELTFNYLISINSNSMKMSRFIHEAHRIHSRRKVLALMKIYRTTTTATAILKHHRHPVKRKIW